MNEKTAKEAIKKLREQNTERKFKQTVELIVGLKDINLKNPDEQVEFFMQARKPFRKQKVCAVVGGELEAEAKKYMDTVITQGELDELKKDKKKVKQLAESHDYFVAQANLMGQIAGVFGRVLGPRGKMPNPKAGCVVPPKASLGPLYERLQNMSKISAKKVPMIQVPVGNESMSDEDIAENLAYFYDQIEHHLPKERHNVKSVYIKFTMSKPVKVQ